MRDWVTVEDMPEFGLTGDVDQAELNAATDSEDLLAFWPDTGGRTLVYRSDLEVLE
jgi:hypothetical protein